MTPDNPHYQDDAVVIYHGNCLTVQLTDQPDLICTDPPYPNNAGHFLAGIADAEIFMRTFDCPRWLIFWHQLTPPNVPLPLVARHIWHRTNTNRPDNYEAIYEFAADGIERPSIVFPYAVISEGLTGCLEATGHPTQKTSGLCAACWRCARPGWCSTRSWVPARRYEPRRISASALSVSRSKSGTANRGAQIGTRGARVMTSTDNPTYAERLVVVAAVYRAANTDGPAPTPVAAVAAAFDIPHARAAGWVKQARRRGLLEPTAQGRSRPPICRHRCPACCPPPSHV